MAVAPEVRAILTQMETSIAEATGKFLFEPDQATHNAQLEYMVREFRKMCNGLVTLRVVTLENGNLQMQVSRADGEHLLEKVGWDTLNAMLNKGYVLIEEK